MRIISFCADGIRDAAERGLFEWINEQDADVVCIQNLGVREHKLQDSVYFPPEYNAYFFDAAEEDVNGVAIYTRRMPKAIMTGLGFTDFDMEGRYIQADFEELSVGCLLAPSAYPGDAKAQARKNQFYELLYNHLNKIRNKRREFIFCGNWNIAHRSIDIQDNSANQGVSGNLSEEQQWLERLFHELGYVDAFRQAIKDPDEFTWWPSGEMGVDGWRVDYQIVSSRLKNAIEYGAIYKNQQFGSHAPLIMDYDYELQDATF